MTPESVLCSHVLRGVFYCFLRVCFQSFCLAVFVCGCVFSLLIKNIEELSEEGLRRVHSLQAELLVSIRPARTKLQQDK
jgi:hypothetical protein